jgi:exodeoxyribonuclease VII large subunit
VLRRFAWLRLHLCDVPVQGENAAGKIAAAIKELNAGKRPVDVILLARGGGSLEDLWAFNEEIVARAVAASAIPIVTGIGHEVDVSIADLVADHHTHTPTEAAQAVTARWRNARDLIDISHTRLRRGLRQLVETARQRLIAIRRHEVFRRPLDRVIALRQLLDDRQRALTLAAAGAMRGRAATLAALEGRWAQRHPRQVVALRRAQLDSLKGALEKAVRDDRRRRETKLDALAAHLRAVGPQEVLRRGYSITARKKDGTIIRAAEQVKPGDVLVTRLADGSIESVAGDPKQPTLF